MNARSALALGLAFLAGCASIAHDPGRRARIDELEQAEVDRRLRFIESRLADEAPAAARWSYGWFVAYGTLAVGQTGAAIAINDSERRKDLAVGAFSSAIGVLPFALFPFKPRFASGALARVPDDTSAARRRKLAVAERLLLESAESEAFGRSWMSHAGSLAANVAFSVVLIAGYHRAQSGLNSLILGTGIGEIQILTQPVDLIDAWRAYREGRFDATEGRPFRFELMPSPAGLGVGGRF